MIPVFRPSYNNREVKAVRKVLLSGWIGLGPKTKEFEDAFAKYIGTKYAVALNSCTAALHLALKVLEIENKEIITTPMTFVSTNHAILYNNAIPVFTDIEPDTLCINPEEIKKNITRKTKAIICVHFGGHPCDMDIINKIAKLHNLFVIEDAAHACGAEYKNRKIGTLGDMACFSFHAVKNLATGDGGMITTNDEKVYKRLLKLRWCGISKDTWSRDKNKKYSWYYNVEEAGFKYHMNDINAVIGLVQLEKLNWMNGRREAISQMYNQAFNDLDWVETPVVKNYAKSARHNYVIKTPYRDQLNVYLQKKGISTGVHYFPNNLYKMYKKYSRQTPVSDKIWKKLLTLPLYPDLTKKQIRFIIKTIKDFKK